MRTTVDIDEKLLRAAKKAAAERGVPLRRIVEESLVLALNRHATRSRDKPKLRWKVTAGPALPGVDFADRDRLCDLSSV